MWFGLENWRAPLQRILFFDERCVFAAGLRRAFCGMIADVPENPSMLFFRFSDDFCSGKSRDSLLKKVTWPAFERDFSFVILDSWFALFLSLLATRASRRRVAQRKQISQTGFDPIPQFRVGKNLHRLSICFLFYSLWQVRLQIRPFGHDQVVLLTFQSTAIRTSF